MAPAAAAKLGALAGVIATTIGMANLPTAQGTWSGPPVRGWSSWNTFAFNATDSLVRSMADYMVKNGFKEAGYDYILIDDGWSLCKEHGPDPWGTPGGCKDSSTARDPKTGEILADKVKFPHGMKAVADYVHSKGLKIGIYTGVGPKTCGGYEGSFEHEEEDVRAWAKWGVDFIKHDVCLDYCGIHDGCLQAATKRMGDAIAKSGRDIVYYVDNGPTNPPRVYNPKLHGINATGEEMSKLTFSMKPSELIFYWAPKNGANMWKPWMDIVDDYYSTLDNAYAQINYARFQSCGQYNFPDMLTIGQGAQTDAEYRTQMALWAVLGSPLIIGADVRALPKTDKDLLLNKRVLAVQGDKDCIQGSLARLVEGGQTWVKPLSDGSFAAALVNPTSRTATLPLFVASGLPEKYLWQYCGDWYKNSKDRRPLSCNGDDIWPATFPNGVRIVDLWTGKEVASFKEGVYTANVASHDTAFVRVYPL